MRLLLLLLFVLVAYFGWKWFAREYSEKGRPFLVKALLISIAVLLVLLAAAGRVHWVGAALASLLAAARMLLPLALRGLPLFMKWRQAQAEEKSGQKTSLDAGEMDEETALATLGLEKPTSREQIVAAHKRIIQSIHPDKGGSDLLAAQVNAAKTFLLKLYPE